MSLNISQGGASGDFELPPEGQYIARCCKVIDLGTQTVKEFGGDGTKQQAKVMITWELLDEDKRMSDGRPYLISSTYTASLHEKSKLYQDLVAWRGRNFTQDELDGFDISKLLGAYCAVQVIHNQSGERTFANLNTIMGTKERPEPVNPTVMFDMSKPDMEVFEGLSDYLKDKIRASAEWSHIDGTKPLELPGFDDGAEPVNLNDIPF